MTGGPIDPLDPDLVRPLMFDVDKCVIEDLWVIFADRYSIGAN